MSKKKPMGIAIAAVVVVAVVVTLALFVLNSNAPSIGNWKAEASISPSAGSGSRTVTGDVVDTKKGEIQVQVKLSGDQLVSVKVLKAPDKGPNEKVSNQVIPTLNWQPLAAQSADIDTVSGATYTSDGYIKSLQSALDQGGV